MGDGRRGVCRRLASPSILGTCLTARISRAEQSRVPCRGSLQQPVYMFEISDAAKRDIEAMDWVGGDIPTEGGGEREREKT